MWYIGMDKVDLTFWWFICIKCLTDLFFVVVQFWCVTTSLNKLQEHFHTHVIFLVLRWNKTCLVKTWRPVTLTLIKHHSFIHENNYYQSSFIICWGCVRTHEHFLFYHSYWKKNYSNRTFAFWPECFTNFLSHSVVDVFSCISSWE